MLLRTNNQLKITAYGLQSVTGTLSSNLLKAITSNKAGFSNKYCFKNEIIQNGKNITAVTAPMPNYDGLTADYRMYLILQGAILDATNYLIENKLEKNRHLLFIVLPASVYFRSNLINIEEWKKFLIEGLERFTDLQFYFINSDKNVIKHLQLACTKLHEGKFNSLVFAGIDSLLDEHTVSEFLKKDRLFTTGESAGVIPGEAAAAVIIQSVKTNNVTSLASFERLAHTEQSINTNTNYKPHSGLSNVIEEIVKSFGNKLNDIDCIIRNSSTEHYIELEWLLTKQKNWPSLVLNNTSVLIQSGNTVSIQTITSSYVPEELHTSCVLGEVGAASIPLGLIIACARFNSKQSVINNCLVTEANEFPFRGAIFLQNPKN